MQKAYTHHLIFPLGKTSFFLPDFDGRSMRDEFKTKKQLISELVELRRKVAATETSVCENTGIPPNKPHKGATAGGETKAGISPDVLEASKNDEGFFTGEYSGEFQVSEHEHAIKISSEIARMPHLLLESLPHPAMLIRKDLTILAANQLALRMGAKIEGLCWREFAKGKYIPQVDKEYIEKNMGQLPPGGTRCSFCLAAKALDKKKAFHLANISLFGCIWQVWWIPIDTNTFLHYAIDTTESRLSEEKLKTSEARFREFFNHMSSGAVVFDFLEGKNHFIFRDINRAGEKIVQVKREDLVGKSPLEVFPRIKEMGIPEVFKRVWESGTPEHHPVSFHDTKGMNRWVETYVFKLPSGEIVAVFDDVSDRKQAEEAVRYSQARYRAVVEDQTELISRFSRDGTLTFVNEAYCRYFREPREELIGSKFWHHLPEADHSKLRKHISCLTPEKPFAVIEHRIVSPDGEIHWVRWTDRAIFDDQSNLVEYQAVGLDITKGKRAELLSKARAKRIHLLNRIIGWGNKSPDLKCLLEKFLDSTIHLMHFDGGVIYLPNEAGMFTELHHQKGLSEEFLAQLNRPECMTRIGDLHNRRKKPLFLDSLSDLLPDSSDPKGFKCFVLIPLFANTRCIGAVHLFGKNKRSFTPEEKRTFQTIGREMGTVIAKMQAEEALRGSENKLRSLSTQLLSAQEKERRRISKELHDELGQALMVLKLRVRLIERQLKEEQEDVRNECEETLQYVDEIIENVRRLSRDLSPSILEDLGLCAALRWLFEDFRRHHKIKCIFDISELKGPFSKEMEIAIYRIFQESLTNIVKHAEATSVVIVAKKINGFIVSTIEDNGKGFCLQGHSGKKATDKGMGLPAMDERVRMLGGSLDIWSRKGEGTRITFTIPIERKGNG